MARRGDDGVLKPLSQKEVEILQVASDVEFRYLSELKDFFDCFCDQNLDVFNHQVKELLTIPLKFFNPPLENEFVHENGFKLRLFMQIFREGNDLLLQRIMRKADW